MRILHLADRLTGRGGAYWHLLGIIEQQMTSHSVQLAVGRVDGGMEPSCPVSVFPGLASRVAEAVDLASLVRVYRPDVMHLHNVVNPVVLAWAAERESVITVQDHRFFCPGKGKWTESNRVCSEAMNRDLCRDCFADEAYFQEIYSLTEERLSTLKALRVIVLSRYMKRELVAAGVPEGRIAVIPPWAHGLDREARPAGPPSVLFVGRLVEAKGVRDALLAWRLSGLDLPFRSAGTGPLRDEVQAAGGEVLGWVDRQRLSAAYRGASVLVLPSRWQEPFGIVGLEALTLGTPVAAWDSGGVSEWHPGSGLVTWGDRELLAAALRELAGQRAQSPCGFEPAPLMTRLELVYQP